MMSTFSGLLPELKSVSVDRFDGLNLQSTAYFLSHLHSDHMIGLKSEAFRQRLASSSTVKLHAHAVTCALMAADPSLSHLRSHCNELQTDIETSIVIPGRHGEDDQTVNVTLVSAGHCAGSVMFIFENDFGSVLYTGDFRFRLGHSQTVKCFRSPLDFDVVRTFDKVYLDTTFLSPLVNRFPSREESTRAVIKLVGDWISKGPDHVVLLEYKSNLGCEHVFKSVSAQFDCKVHVKPAKHKWYHSVPQLSGFTTKMDNTPVHACGRGPKECFRGKNVREIVISAMTFAMSLTRRETVEVVRKLSEDTYRVNYSIHCSAEELRDFVQFLRPVQLVPNVTTAENREDIQKLLDGFKKDLLKSDFAADKEVLLGDVSDWLSKRILAQQDSGSDSDSDLDFGEDYKPKKKRKI